jgi:hypothetical protein
MKMTKNNKKKRHIIKRGVQGCMEEVKSAGKECRYSCIGVGVGIRKPMT